MEERKGDYRYYEITSLSIPSGIIPILASLYNLCQVL